jgi:hypothetical protein
MAVAAAFAPEAFATVFALALLYLVCRRLLAALRHRA